MFILHLLLRQRPLSLPIVLPLSIKERFHFPLNSTTNGRYVLTYGHVVTLSLPVSQAMGNGPGRGRKAGGERSWMIPSRPASALITTGTSSPIRSTYCWPLHSATCCWVPQSIPSLRPGGDQGSSLTCPWCLDVPLSPLDCTHIIINSLFTKASSITQLKGTFPFLLEPYLIREVLNKHE